MRLSTIFKLPRALLRRVGFDVVHYSAHVNALNAMKDANSRRIYALKEYGIDIVLDVGASEGHYAAKLRQSGYAGRLISFEPLSESYKVLLGNCRLDSAWQAIHTAIGDYDGTSTINVSARSTSSSLLDMAPAHTEAAPGSAYVSREQVSVSRLDTALAAIVRPGNRLYLKIDVQGYEASVLAGALETIKATQVVEVEVSMVALYDGSTLYAEMIQTLDALGFHLISWEDVFTDPHSGYVLQSDCIFARRT